MKILLAMIASLSLAGCATAPPQFITKTQLQVVMPERTMFYCQNVRHFPNPDTLTDVEVAKLIVLLHSRNTECQKNMNAIYEFLDEAKKKTDKKTEQKR